MTREHELSFDCLPFRRFFLYHWPALQAHKTMWNNVGWSFSPSASQLNRMETFLLLRQVLWTEEIRIGSSAVSMFSLPPLEQTCHFEPSQNGKQPATTTPHTYTQANHIQAKHWLLKINQWPWPMQFRAGFPTWQTCGEKKWRRVKFVRRKNQGSFKR